MKKAIAKILISVLFLSCSLSMVYGDSIIEAQIENYKNSPKYSDDVVLSGGSFYKTIYDEDGNAVDVKCISYNTYMYGSEVGGNGSEPDMSEEERQQLIDAGLMISDEEYYEVYGVYRNKTDNLTEEVQQENTDINTADNNKPESENDIKADTVKTDNVATGTSIVVTVDKSTYLRNGVLTSMESEPYIRDGSLMVPLSFIFNNFFSGAEDSIDWDANNKVSTVITNISGKKTVVKFDVLNNKIYYNDEEYILENAEGIEITKSRIYVPFRTLGNILNLNVGWNPDTKQASFSDK